MAIDFPNTPVDGEVFTSGTKTWIYNESENAWFAAGGALDTGILTEQGDILVRSSVAVTRQPIGTSGQILYVDDSQDTNIHWQDVTSSGRNAIINGNFSIWQRGTSFVSPASGAYLADRWYLGADGSGATRTISRQDLTLGSAPEVGYEGTYFLRFDQSVAGTTATYNQISQQIESVRTFAGRKVTVSLWAKSAGTTQFSIQLYQLFGTGGSTAVGSTTATFTTSTSWQRFSATFDIASIAGKTVGANNSLRLDINAPVNDVFTLDFWGVQVEQGEIATRFERRSIYDTLRDCQRYYYRLDVGAIGDTFGVGYNTSTTVGVYRTPFPVSMRIPPTAIEQSGTAAHYQISHAATTTTCSSVPTFVSATTIGASTNFTVALGLTAGQGSMARAANVNAYLAWSAEL